MVEKKLQTDNAFLNATHYHYLIASLGLILSDDLFMDQQGQQINRGKISHNLDYQGSLAIEKLSCQQAIDNSSFIGIIVAKIDDDEVEVTVTYTKDTKIRSYLGEEEFPPLLLGYEILNLFISNMSIEGYVKLTGDLTKLGAVFIKGVVGQTKNEKELRNILNGDETKKG